MLTRGCALKLLAAGTWLSVCDAQSTQIVNWFHLQDESGAWRGHMGQAASFFSKFIRTVEPTFPVKLGIGKFYDKHFDHFVLLSGFTRVSDALVLLNGEFSNYAEWQPFTEATKKKMQPIDWPTEDVNLPDSEYHAQESEYQDDAKACLEPLLWAITKLQWDNPLEAARIASIYIAGLPHYEGDTSWSDTDPKLNLRSFTPDVYPYSDKSIWPVGLPNTETPPLSITSKYAALPLVRQILRQQQIELRVYYAPDNNGASPQKVWASVMDKIGSSTSKLWYFPKFAKEDKAGDELLEEHVAELREELEERFAAMEAKRAELEAEAEKK